MKLSKKLITSVAAFSILSAPGTAFITNAHATTVDDYQVINEQNEMGTRAVKPGQIIGMGFKVLKYASNTWLFRPEATTSIGSQSMSVSSGVIGYNDKGGSGYGASSKHDVQISRVGESIETFAETDFINMFTAKIALIVSDPSNNDVVSKTLTHEQYVYYNPKKTGTHTLRYVDENKLNWNIYITLWDTVIVPSARNSSAIKVLDQNGVEVSALYKNDKVYVYPSESHKQTADKYTLDETLSLKDLQLQFFDTELNRNVRNLKNYDIGDTVHFKDSIASIKYDEKKGHTLLGFYDNDGDPVNWAFKGDLTNKYTVGDVLELKIKVVEETNGFENLDIIKNFQDNGEVAEEIDNYLIHS